MKIVVDNSVKPSRPEILLEKAVRAYWRTGQGETHRDAALEFLLPLRTGSPSGLTKKARILEDMVETRRSAEEIAQFAASIADEALCMSRSFLSRAI